MTDDDPRHGTTRGYAAGCKCKPCKAARAKKERDRRKRRAVFGEKLLVSALGTQRRVCALHAMGWRQEDIAAAGGWRSHVQVNSLQHRNSVTLKTAQRMDAVYRKLSMTPGPSPKTARYAARQGWAPPLAWDNIDTDETPTGLPTGRPSGPRFADGLIVRAVIDGARRPEGISVADRRAIVRDLMLAGTVSRAEIALRCGVSQSVVDQDIRRSA